jgi:uncharacterized Rmd1/YagE family protein
MTSRRTKVSQIRALMISYVDTERYVLRFALVIGSKNGKENTRRLARVLFTTSNSTRPQIRRLTRFVFSFGQLSVNFYVLPGLVLFFSFRCLHGKQCGHALFPLPNPSNQIFIFAYGCVVFYGVSENGERAVMSALRHYEAGRLSIRDSRSDSFNYQYMDWKENDNETPLLRVLEDTVLIANAPEDELVLSVKLAAAHAVAQNAKLGSYENAIDLISAKVMHIPGRLATTGSLMLSDRDILKLQGELFSLVSHISISTRIQNIPDWCVLCVFALLPHLLTSRASHVIAISFCPSVIHLLVSRGCYMALPNCFRVAILSSDKLTKRCVCANACICMPHRFWEREHLEPVFICMHRYLNMEQRLGLLNSRMDRLQEMYDLFRDVRWWLLCTYLCFLRHGRAASFVIGSVRGHD